MPGGAVPLFPLVGGEFAVLDDRSRPVRGRAVTVQLREQDGNRLPVDHHVVHAEQQHLPAVGELAQGGAQQLSGLQVERQAQGGFQPFRHGGGSVSGVVGGVIKGVPRCVVRGFAEVEQFQGR